MKKGMMLLGILFLLCPNLAACDGSILSETKMYRAEDVLEGEDPLETADESTGDGNGCG